MNIKYEKLSVVGKVWTLAQTLGAGITDNKNTYVLSAIRKLDELNKSLEVDASMTVNETIDNIVEHAIALKENYMDLKKVDTRFVDNEDIISQIWYNRLLLDAFKFKLKNKMLTEKEEDELDKIYNTIRHIFIVELKEKRFSSKERRDLFKIKEEIEDVIIKFKNAIKHNLI